MPWRRSIEQEARNYSFGMGLIPFPAAPIYGLACKYALKEGYMRSFKNVLFLFSMLVLLFIFGCGGGGGSSPAAATNNPYAGSWQGSWKDPGVQQSGLFTVTVATDGTTTGTADDCTLNISGALFGTTDANGRFSGTVTYPGQTASAFIATFSFSNGLIIGDLVQTMPNGQTISGSFRMNSRNSSSNMYAGNWAGTWSDASDSGDATLSISINGNLTAIIQNTSLGRNSNITGVVDDNGNFSGKVESSGFYPAVITGTLGPLTNNKLASNYIVTVNATEYSGIFNLQKQ